MGSALSIRVVSLVMLLLAAGAALPGAQATPWQTYEPTGMWGGAGTGAGQFSSGAYGLARNAAGVIFVSDRHNGRIEEFDGSGTYLGQFGTLGTGNGQLRYPEGIAVDGLGRIYVAEGSYGRVQRFRWDGDAGQYVHDLIVTSGMFSAAGVAVDSTGQIVYVSDFSVGRIDKLVWDGSQYVLTARLGRNGGEGSSGEGPGEFWGPMQISLTPAGYLYVADSLNNRIQKWGPNDTFVRSYGSLGSGPGQFRFPRMVVEDAEGNLYVTDGGNHRVQKLDADGNVLAILGKNGGDGTAGNGAGEFNWPFGVLLAPDNTLYVSEVGNNRIQKFRRTDDPPRTVTFIPGAGGALTGTTPQTVDHGAATTPVTALPDPCYHFVRWTLANDLFSTDNPITLASVTADLTLTAEFASDRHTLTYLAGPNGSLSDPASQTVDCGSAGAPVTALPAPYYRFVRWSDGSEANPRTDMDVSATLTVTASFATAAAVTPDGDSVAIQDAGAVATGRGLWDLSGTYTTAVDGLPLVIHLVHDSRGKLTGTATLTIAMAEAAMAVRGAVSGVGGGVAARFTLKSAGSNRGLRAAFDANLTLNPATRQLGGQITGTLQAAGATAPVAGPVTLDLPAAMDGTWSLRFALVPGTRGVGGNATLTLSNGVTYGYVVRARLSGLKLVGDLIASPADALATGVRIRATMSQYSGGWARLETLSGSGYGQSLGW